MISSSVEFIDRDVEIDKVNLNGWWLRGKEIRMELGWNYSINNSVFLKFKP
jgi:hypothetical protein